MNKAGSRFTVDRCQNYTCNDVTNRSADGIHMILTHQIIQNHLCILPGNLIQAFKHAFPGFDHRCAFGEKAVVFDTGKVQLLVIENNHEPFDLGMFRSVGIEPTAKRYLLLKSRLHYRAGFLPIAKHIVECNGTGVTSSDYSQFKFSKIRRPIFPLDPNTTA